WTPRLAPLAAALAVIAIVITVVNVRHTENKPSATGSSLGAPPGVPAGPPVSSYVRSDQVPPYYVTAIETDAVVHLTVSGASVATIRPSLPGGTMVAVTAAGDGRTFVLGEQGQDRKAVTFYQFRLGSSGRPGALTRLPISVADGKTMGDVALSPDGTRLAIAVAPGGGVQQVRLYPVSGGPARTWSATDDTSGDPFALGLLSWAANQRTLAFNWGPGQTRSARLLNLGNAGGSLLAASRLAVTLANTANMGQTLYQCGSLVLTPDGSELVCASGDITKIAKDGIITYTTGFPEFSAATGHLTRVMGHWDPNQSHEPEVIDLLWSNASGRVLIGVIHAGGRNWVGMISGNNFTPLNARWALSMTRGLNDFGTW
ncbi:MAG: hypothetical protein ACRDPF_40815, partial [Streptosporangiaceae bacterium]